MSKLMWLSAALGLVLAAQAVRAEVEVKYDRFERSTTVTAAQRPGGASFRQNLCSRPVSFWVAVVPDDPQTGTLVGLQLAAYCSDWTYSRCHSLVALADGEQIRFDQTSHDGDVRSSGRVTEKISTAIGYDVLTRLAAANSVEFQLCRSEWTLSAAELADLRGFKARFDEVSREKGIAEPPPAAGAASPSGPKAAESAPGFSCTNQQREVMKSVGLSGAQIAAACGEAP